MGNRSVRTLMDKFKFAGFLGSITLALILVALPTVAGPEEDFEKGIKAGAKKDRDVAIRHYTNAINGSDKSSPYLAIYHFIRGMTYTGNGQPNLAIADYGTALKLIPVGGRNNRTFRRKIITMRARAYAVKGNFGIALADINSTAYFVGLQPGVLAYRGDIYRRMKKYGFARRDLDRSMEIGRSMKIGPKLGLSYAFRGQLHEEMGNIDRAKKDYVKAYELGGEGRHFIVAIGRAKLIGK